MPNDVPGDNEENLLNDTDEKFLRVLFENIQLYRTRRPESSEVMLPVVAGWAMAAAVDSVQKAYELTEEAKRNVDNGQVKQALSVLSTLFPDPDETSQSQPTNHDDAHTPDKDNSGAEAPEKVRESEEDT